MRFLGIDPGLRITGYGCIEGPGPQARLVEGGVFRLGRAAPPADLSDSSPSHNLTLSPVQRKLAPISARLAELDTDLTALIARLQPDTIAVESLFAHPAHPATAILMAHARGVILLAVRRAQVPLVELKPAEVKRFLTGNGQATKEQMQSAIAMRLGLAAPPRPPDIADALAIALCASWRER